MWSHQTTSLCKKRLIAFYTKHLSPVAVKPPTSGHRYLHNLKKAKKNDRIFQYGIDKMDLDTRLIK
ncbi:hypothetical protein, partial [Psychrobacter pasteurii]|uniref:hypothetical protein n=1 Tax=Psychrobacter pasteurii TaxID=1945520 RepID=UPI001ABF8100